MIEHQPITSIVCDCCKGRKGRFYVDRSWSEYTLDWEDCEECEGNGIVWIQSGKETAARPEQAETRKFNSDNRQGAPGSKPA
jgi:hypothetical protein